MAFSTIKTLAVLNQPRLQARALSATLHTWRGQERRPLSPQSQRLAQWARALTTNLPPANWQLWLAETLQVEEDLHSGTAGVADEVFYTTLHHYLERCSPPAEVCAAMRFREGLARWDFAAVASAAERLLQPISAGQAWMDADQFRDGAVVAKLFLGDVAGARRYFEALAGHVGRSARDLRTRLLNAYLQAPEKLPERPRSTATVSWTCRNTSTAHKRGD